jgi:CheY-like chemotaxis protein
MEKAVVCGSENLRNIFRRQHGFYHWQPYASPASQLKGIDLLIVEEKPRRGDLDGFTDGYRFIQDLRVDAGCELPIILVLSSVQGTDSPHKDLIAEDPFVYTMPSAKVIQHSAPKDFNKYFPPPIPKEESDLWFTDLRLTLYQDEGYIDELRHQILGLLEKLKSWEGPDEWYKVRQLISKTRRVVEEWHLNNHLPKLDIALGDSFPKLRPMDLRPIIKDWYDQLHDLVRRQPGTVALPGQPSASVLYISDEQAHQDMLKEQLGTLSSDLVLDFLFAEDLKSARQEAKALPNNHLVTVIADFRFRDKQTGKRGQRNGIMIIDQLRREYPNWQYLLLSNFPVRSYKPLMPSYPLQIFSKDDVLKKASTLLRELAAAIIAYHNQQRAQLEDEWPAALSSKEDDLWSNLYKAYITLPDFKKREMWLSEQAETLIEDMLQHKTVEGAWKWSLRRPLSRVTGSKGASRQSRKNRMTINLSRLEERLLFRRVCIGYLAVSPKKRAKPRALFDTKEAYEQIAKLTCAHRQGEGTDKTLFSCSRILPSKAYDKNSPYITMHESRWLARFIKKHL